MMMLLCCGAGDGDDDVMFLCGADNGYEVVMLLLVDW